MTINVAADQLRLFLERIERLEDEKRGIAADIKDVYAEAKNQGYDTATMRDLVKLRKMDTERRREREALLDTYKAALGMLDGTPLGRWAVERLKPKPPAKDPDAPGDDGAEAPPPAAPQAPPAPAEPAATVEDARRMGAQSAAAGEAVTRNPFPPYDERRAAWDEAWCAALGSDGMDIPDALKPAPKPAAKPAGKSKKKAEEPA